MRVSRGQALFGTDEPVPPTTQLRAGPLTLALRAGRLWHVCVGDVEVWHGIAFLYRDADWGTPEPVVERFEPAIAARSFRIRCAGHFPTAPVIDFRLDVEGTRDGVVRFTGEAVPRDDINTNRMGLCVMHPLTACGTRLEVQHVDSRTSRSTFPRLILPWPPFMLIRAIRHEYAPGRWARCKFEGDAFELEDQRNNSDASFKTYNRSNMMPRPYWLRAGVAIRQSVELALENKPASTRRRRDGPVLVRVGAPVADLPSIGIEVAPEDARSPDVAAAMLAAMRPRHLHLALDSNAGNVDWRMVAGLLDVAGATLRVDVSLHDTARADEALTSLRDAMHSAGVAAESVAVFPTEQRSVDAARRVFSSSRIGGGSPHFFVQLNRAEMLGSVDFLTFTSSAIVHGAADESVMQSLQSLPSMMATLNTRCPGIPVRIGPSGIAARASPLGRQPASDGTRRIALAQADPRSRGLFGAAWLLGYVAQLATTGIEAITMTSMSEAAGAAVHGATGIPTRFPVAHVLDWLRGPARVLCATVSPPSRVAALALERPEGSGLLLANLTGSPVDIDLRGFSGCADVRVMDARTLRDSERTGRVWRTQPLAAKSPHVTLDAYAIARAGGRD